MRTRQAFKNMISLCVLNENTIRRGQLIRINVPCIDELRGDFLRQGKLVEHLRAAKVGDGPVDHWEACRPQPLKNHEVKLQAWRVETVLEVFPCFGDNGRKQKKKMKE
jgi:hypothetical protein